VDLPAVFGESQRKAEEFVLPNGHGTFELQPLRTQVARQKRVFLARQQLKLAGNLYLDPREVTVLVAGDGDLVPSSAFRQVQRLVGRREEFHRVAAVGTVGRDSAAEAEVASALVLAEGKRVL